MFVWIRACTAAVYSLQSFFLLPSLPACLAVVQGLAEAADAGDVEAFTAAVADFDSLTRLDAWKTTLLVGAACAVHAVHAAAASAAADSHACTGGGCWRPLIPRLPAV